MNRANANCKFPIITSKQIQNPESGLYKDKYNNNNNNNNYYYYYYYYYNSNNFTSIIMLYQEI